MSAKRYSRDMAKVSVAKMLQTIGWNSINATPLEILTDILVQYVLQIGKTANDYANEFGCTEPNLDHIGLAFRDCHINLPELEEYVTYVDFAQSPILVPKYPLYKEDNLNFLKPGSKECLTRPVHIHEHLPSLVIPEDSCESNPNTTVSVNNDETQQETNTKDEGPDNTVFKRPAEVSPGESYNRIRTTSTSSEAGPAEAAEPQGRPTREISSVMMTTSGFISPAREGRLPDSRTPIIQGPISEPPSPEPPSETTASNEAVEQNIKGEVEPVTTPIIVVDDTPEEAQLMDAIKQEMPITYDANESGTSEQIGEHVQIPRIVPRPSSPYVTGAIPTVLMPILKKPKAPRKLDHQTKQRKEKQPFPIVEPGQPGIQQPSDRPAASKPRKSSNQASRELARQLKKQQQHMLQQALMQSAELDQPMNLSTSAPAQQTPLPDVGVSVGKAKAKVNRTLAAARRKTEKLNTTITPIPMPARATTSVDKLFTEPDKKKVNILKKISNVRNEARPARPVVHVEEEAPLHQMLPSDVTIELVNVRNNQGNQQHNVSHGEPQSSTSMPVKEKRKRKEKVAKPRKVAKQMPPSSNSPNSWDDLEVVERPQSPEVAHTHNFTAALGKLPAALASAGVPFPFLSQFSGPGLIPNFQSPLFPNHLLPQAYALNNLCNNIVPQPQPSHYDVESRITERAESQLPSSSNALPPPYQPARPGRPRKNQQQPTVSSDGAYQHQAQGHVSSTVTSPDCASDYRPYMHQQMSYPPTSVTSTVTRTDSPHHSSPGDAVVGSTVILTPPSHTQAAADEPDVDTSMPSTSAAVASTSRDSPAPESEDLPQLNLSIVKAEKKNREHKKDKKDKTKKKSKKDKTKKLDKLEKKKLREELKIKLKKEKKEKKKEKDMLRNNQTDNLSVPKLTLKLGSPPSKSGQQDPSGSESAKLIVKPIILRKEDSTSAVVDDGDKTRESSPELARISPLVTGQPKPKSVQPTVPSTHYKLEKDSASSSLVVSSATSTVVSTGKAHHVGPGRPRKPTVKRGDDVLQQQDVGRVKLSRQQLHITSQPDSQGNEVWICPHCGKQDDGSPMIGCDDCDAWYHWVCVNMQVPPEENEDWYCKNCIKKRMQSSLQPDKKKKRKKKDRKEH